MGKVANKLYLTKALLVTFFLFFSTVKYSLTVANISEGNRCAELKVANPGRDATFAESVVVQLSKHCST